jgi:6-pyruvoyltetrahydropterin/6-carboxytetrahydropterin synthase
MYRLTVKEHFDAAHTLRGYAGECANLHGHTWDIEATVEGEALDGIGILYDFKRLKADLRAVLSDYDHTMLDDVPPFDGINATAENLARVIFERLTPKVGEGARLVEVAVWESPVARVAWTP